MNQTLLQNWKKRYKKRPDEKPFPVFSSLNCCRTCGTDYTDQLAKAENGTVLWVNKCCTTGLSPFSELSHHYPGVDPAVEDLSASGE